MTAWFEAVGLSLLAILSYISYRLKATDLSGSLAAFLIGSSVGLTAGWLFVAYLVFFLAVGTVATRYRYQYKSSLHAAQEKGGARGAANILANGGVATVFAFLFWVFSQPLFAALFVASIASSLADTLATEVGLLSRQRPKMITDPSSDVEPGRSGGVTWLGFLAEVSGSLAFALLAYILNLIEPRYIIIATIAGVVGSNVDSLLGATVQGYFFCSVCGEYTEKSEHCNHPANRVKGTRWLNNNIVNLLSSIFAAGAALALQFAL